MVRAKLGDLNSTMAIENSKKEDVFADTMEKNSVFHIFSPS
jgi:hypothetical protein